MWRKRSISRDESRAEVTAEPARSAVTGPTFDAGSEHEPDEGPVAGSAAVAAAAPPAGAVPAAPPAAPAPVVPSEPTGSDMVRLAMDLEWADARPHLAAMELVARDVNRRPQGTVVVTGGADVQPWVSILEQLWPGLHVTTVPAAEDSSEAHVRLTIAGPIDVVIDASDTTGQEQALLFQRLFMHLDKGGAYIARRLVPSVPSVRVDPVVRPSGEDGGSRLDDALPNENVPPEPPYAGDLWEMVSEAQAARLRDFADHAELGDRFRDVAGLGAALAEVHVHSKVLRVVNGTLVAPKLREEEVDAVLAARPGLGERLHALPPVTWASECSYEVNRPDDPYVQEVFRVPAMTLRRYERPICSRGQIVTKDNLLLPETFRQSWMERMANVYVVEKAPRFGVVRRDISKPDLLPGAYFHLDSEWPGHFGHLLTEQLGRLWAFERVRESEPELKLLTTLQHDREPAVLARFETEILGSFNIEPGDVHVFTSPCAPERLYTATSMYSLPRYVHPDMARLWDRVGDHLVRDVVDAPCPERLFVSRRPSLKRACHNTPEVEEFFAGHGYEVVYPEEHPLSEQVAMFRAADDIAGFAGSGLFSLAFCRTPKRVIALSPDAYTARNEHLISAVRGHSLTAVRSRSDLEHPEGTWTQAAFASAFTFDFDDEGRYLAEHLTRVGA